MMEIHDLQNAGRHLGALLPLLSYQRVHWIVIRTVKVAQTPTSKAAAALQRIIGLQEDCLLIVAVLPFSNFSALSASDHAVSSSSIGVYSFNSVCRDIVTESNRWEVTELGNHSLRVLTILCLKT